MPLRLSFLLRLLLLALVSLSCLPAPAHAQEKTTVGGACTTERNVADWDTIMQCANSLWQRGALFLGVATDTAGAAITCNTANAGLMQWASENLKVCNGTSWTNLNAIDSYTKLLLHMDGTNASTTFTDSSATANTGTAYGSAQLTTSYSKFGTAGGSFTGTSYLIFPNSSDWSLGADSFTLDTWVRFNTISIQQIFVAYGDFSTGGSWFLYLDTSNNLRFGYYPSGNSNASMIISAPWTGLATGTWYHVAIVRNGSSWMLFVNGTQLGSTVTDSTTLPTSTSGLVISGQYFGGSIYGANYLSATLDELRISKGIARWTSNFTPPVYPY